MAEFKIYKKSSRLFGSSQLEGSIWMTCSRITTYPTKLEVYRHSSGGLFGSKVEIGGIKVYDSSDREYGAYIKKDGIFFHEKGIDIDSLYPCYRLEYETFGSIRGGYGHEGDYSVSASYFDKDKETMDPVAFSYALSLFFKSTKS